MIVLGGLVPLVLLGVAALQARKRGSSLGKVALLIIVGAACVLIVTFGILAWGFSGFG